MIFEVVIITIDSDNIPNVAPMGITKINDVIVLKPFKPSQTLENILNTKNAVLNITTDVEVFAACITGKKEFDLEPIEGEKAFRLKNTISFSHLTLEKFIDDDIRPQLLMKQKKVCQLNEFLGLNRAQAAVVEGSILASRLKMLPIKKIRSEMEYLRIAISKTGGVAEKKAWSWLEDAVKNHEKEIKKKLK